MIAPKVGRVGSILLLDSASSMFERNLPTVPRIIERHRLGIKRVRVEAAPCPLQHRVMIRVTTVADDLQEFHITMRTTNVFWRTGARASHAARVGRCFTSATRPSTPRASRLVEHGVPLSQVRDLLGYASIVTTERYDHQRPEALFEAAKRLETGESFKNLSRSTGDDPAKTPQSDLENDARLLEESKDGSGVDDGVRTRDFRSHSPALYR